MFYTSDIIKVILNKDLTNTYYTFPVYMSPSYEKNELLQKLFNNNTTDYYNDFVNKIDLNIYNFDYNFYTRLYNDISNLSYNQALHHWLTIGIKQGRICNNIKNFIPLYIHKWKGWLNHYIYNPSNIHYLNCFRKELLNKVGGTCIYLKNEYIYDNYNNDFLNRIRKVYNVKLIDSNVFGIYQYYKNDIIDYNLEREINILKKNNNNILNYNINNNIIYYPLGFDNIKTNIIKNNICYINNYDIIEKKN